MRVAGEMGKVTGYFLIIFIFLMVVKLSYMHSEKPVHLSEYMMKCTSCRLILTTLHKLVCRTNTTELITKARNRTKVILGEFKSSLYKYKTWDQVNCTCSRFLPNSPAVRSIHNNNKTYYNNKNNKIMLRSKT